VELIDRDPHGPGEQRLAPDPNDCRGPGGSEWEEVAVFNPAVPVRYRSRVAEIARLLGQNYQRFNMTPATGLIRYVRRPQERPEFDRLIRPLVAQLASEFRARRLGAVGPGGPAEFALDPRIDPERLVRAADAVLGAFPEPSLAEFQVRSLRATLAGLYSPEYRRRADAHVITSGVGSGKTYAFQLGALIHVAYRAIAGERGLRVLLMYPRVVLAANQFQDLAKLVADVSARLGVPLRPPLLDAGGQLPGQLGYAPDAAGKLFNSIRDAYGGGHQILISNLDTLANRLAHPEAYRGFASLDLVVLDEVHVLRGLYGAHARMLLKRLQLIRAVGSPGGENRRSRLKGFSNRPRPSRDRISWRRARPSPSQPGTPPGYSI
jgi:ATP-dependent helicase YprA (DUF1998 family)